MGRSLTFTVRVAAEYRVYNLPISNLTSTTGQIKTLLCINLMGTDRFQLTVGGGIPSVTLQWNTALSPASRVSDSSG